MSSPFVQLYERVFSALKAYPGITTDVDPDTPALVPEENVRPTDDPLEAVPGASIIYSISGSHEDLKARRFEGAMAVTTGSPLSKIAAHELMALARRALVPRALTGSGVRVAMFEESDQARDAGKTNESWRVVTEFRFKFVLE